jgi:hypothetical protein
MRKDEALKLALEALEADPLEMVADANGHMVFLKDQAITAIKEALANHIEDNLAMVAQPTPAEYAMGYAEGFNDGCKPKPEQEPVAWINEDELPESYPYDAMFPYSKVDIVRMFPVFCPQPQRTWVGLKDEDMGFLFPHGTSVWVQETVKIIEAKLKEKNNG